MNLSHYKNEVVKISEADDASMWGGGTRISGNVTRTTKGHAISEFYGYKVNGFYENVDEVLRYLLWGKMLKMRRTLRLGSVSLNSLIQMEMVSWMEMTAPLSVLLILT